MIEDTNGCMPLALAQLDLSSGRKQMVQERSSNTNFCVWIPTLHFEKAGAPPFIAGNGLPSVQGSSHLPSNRTRGVCVPKQIHDLQNAAGEAVGVPQRPQRHCKAVHAIRTPVSIDDWMPVVPSSFQRSFMASQIWSSVDFQSQLASLGLGGVQVSSARIRLTPSDL
eukprot:CAMPEP_0181419196 /NCGR_PEP_ID=MMETSP1110-20121109/11949_1 /TAXON_ID=174948 /ORGANISM="Symbiodinium sp., Strain CCMP421" /LENGTH=166 /DNA_ID=CAMNT_0023542205 /DNA_START=410 /DNA_END=908 /DNA_ORIENTATION=+